MSAKDTSAGRPTDVRKKRPAPRGLAAYPRKRAVAACEVCRARRTKCDNLKPSCTFCLKSNSVCIRSSPDLSGFDPASLEILERLNVVETLVRLLSPEAPSQLAAPRSDFSDINLRSVIPERVEDVLAWPAFRDISSPLGPRPASSSSPAISSSTSAVALLADDPHRMTRLSQRFFSLIHVKNPILSEESARRLVSMTVVEGIDWTPSSCLCLLISALGAIATPFGQSLDTMPGTEAFSIAQSLFSSAEKRLGPAFTSGGIVSAQCFFLSGVFMMNSFQPRKAWRYFLQALAICQDFSSSDTSEPDGASQSGDQDLRTLQEAIYWSSWKSERETRVELDVKDFVLDDKSRSMYPVFFPTPPALKRSDEAVGAEHITEAMGWYFYLSEISLRRLSLAISGEILSYRAEIGSNIALINRLATEVPVWQRQLQEWIRSLPPALCFDAPPEQDDICRFILRGHAMDLTEIIYWPFTVMFLEAESPSLSPSPAPTTSLKPEPFTDSGIIELAQNGLEAHARRIEINKAGFEHRNHGTWLMIRSCTRSALILVAFALKMKQPSNTATLLHMPHDWRQRVLAVVQLLRHWEGECPELGHRAYTLEHAISCCGPYEESPSKT